MAEPQAMYLFTRGQTGIFSEVYFPKRVAYQGRIYTSLEEGYDEEQVKTYLSDHAESLLVELAEYPNLFNPYQYGDMEQPQESESAIDQSRKRIEMYQSPFRGWSMYEVDGMFFDAQGRVYEERTQVIRLMFRFESSYMTQAVEANAQDVLRSILMFVVGMRGALAQEEAWSEQNKQRYLSLHEEWVNPAKRQFAEQNFTAIARETVKWIDHCALFIFGYLVRSFSERVLETQREEEEIWVVSFFDMNLNVIRRIERQ